MLVFWLWLAPPSEEIIRNLCILKKASRFDDSNSRCNNCNSNSVDIEIKDRTTLKELLTTGLCLWSRGFAWELTKLIKLTVLDLAWHYFSISNYLVPNQSTILYNQYDWHPTYCIGNNTSKCFYPHPLVMKTSGTLLKIDSLSKNWPYSLFKFPQFWSTIHAVWFIRNKPIFQPVSFLKFLEIRLVSFLRCFLWNFIR